MATERTSFNDGWELPIPFRNMYIPFTLEIRFIYNRKDAIRSVLLLRDVPDPLYRFSVDAISVFIVPFNVIIADLLMPFTVPPSFAPF